ncbi:MAG: 3-deoxy-manno-octulosonate cytidylyltransferase [Rhodospirillales bacterium]
MRPIVLIPARLASTRLPNKPLADIAGKPMIVQVLERAQAAGVGPVAVACAEASVADAVEAAGGQAILTDPDLPSGTDRIHQALLRLDPTGLHDVVINVQGDLPSLPPEDVRIALEPLAADPACDIATLAARIHEPAERSSPDVVKIATVLTAQRRIARALYFSRAPIPWAGADDSGPLLHHIGLYAYRRSALERFVALPPSPLELRERLEQLRALEAGLRIDVALVDSVPLGVDTAADLERARRLLGG